jgi:glucose-6-phosphate isomerase
MLLGASTMTRQFLEEPFERNPVLQLAGICYLMTQELGKPIRVLSAWSKKLEALGFWYDQLVSESLGKQGLGPTPITCVGTRDLHSRGQQHQEGRRDKLFLNLVVKQPKNAALAIGMADRNEDDLNQFSRKNYPALMEAAHKGTSEAYAEAGRPGCDITIPSLTEHTMGQLMQLLMLATVVEGRLMGINPYGQPGVEAYKRKMIQQLSSGVNMSRQNVLAPDKPAGQPPAGGPG